MSSLNRPNLKINHKYSHVSLWNRFCFREFSSVCCMCACPYVCVCAWVRERRVMSPLYLSFGGRGNFRAEIETHTKRASHASHTDPPRMCEPMICFTTYLWRLKSDYFKEKRVLAVKASGLLGFSFLLWRFLKPSGETH